MAHDATSVAVLGASGYTGAELLRVLVDHPRVRVVALCGNKSAGQPATTVFPHLAGRIALDIETVDAVAIAERAEVAFLALPHGHSAQVAKDLRAAGGKLRLIVDLSADFRLRDHGVYREWYGEHPCPELLEHAVYGLPELSREGLAGADLIAAPGCYPTATVLPIAPLLRARLIEPSPLVVDAKSGVSGAGRTPSLAAHLPEAAEGVRPYKVAGSHRHTPEIEQALSRIAGTDVVVTFTPHLLPMSRGILSCVYAQPSDPGRDPGAYLACLRSAYQDEPFVTVLEDSLPDTAHVRGSNRAQVAVRYDQRAGRVVAMAAIDNLVKGAAGQAVQCMNLALGFGETEGLGAVAMFP